MLKTTTKMHVKQWRGGGSLYVEKDGIDESPVSKSKLIHYHDEKKGKDSGGAHKMKIFSVMSPGCLPYALGGTCGRLTIDANSPPAYYFSTVLPRVASDVCRRSKQIPLSALFQRGYSYTMMFDIDVKETSVEFNDNILTNWGRLFIETVQQFYPKCSWTSGIPHLVCSRPKNLLDCARVQFSCEHCDSENVVEGVENNVSYMKCLDCNMVGSGKKTVFYKLGAHFDFCQIRNETMSTIYQDSHTDDSGNTVYTGCSPIVNRAQILKIREMAVSKIVKMTEGERRKLGLDLLQSGLMDVIDLQIYGSDYAGDIPSSMCRSSTNGSLRPCFVSKTKTCGCKAHYEKRGLGVGFDPDCGLCKGKGKMLHPERKYIPVKVLDSDGHELVEFQERYFKDPKYEEILDLLRLTSHHLVGAIPQKDYVTPGFVTPDGFVGGVSSETDIVVGENMTDDEIGTNNALMGIGLDGYRARDARRFQLEVDPNRSGGVVKKKKTANVEPPMYFNESSKDGLKMRKMITGIIHRLWPRYLKECYIGSLCLCHFGCKDPVTKAYNQHLRTVYIVSIAGQGSGFCPNAKYCACEYNPVDRGRGVCQTCRRKAHTEGCHRQNKSNIRIQITWNGKRAVFERKCYSASKGLDGKPCNSCKMGKNGKYTKSIRALETFECTPKESAIFFPIRYKSVSRKKQKNNIDQLTHEINQQKRSASTEGSDKNKKRKVIRTVQLNRQKELYAILAQSYTPISKK